MKGREIKFSTGEFISVPSATPTEKIKARVDSPAMASATRQNMISHPDAFEELLIIAVETGEAENGHRIKGN